MATEWEYEEFHWNFNQGWLKTRLSEVETTSTARRWMWEESQGYFLPEYQKLIDQGWQPISEVGPSAIVLREFKETHSNVNGGYVLYWIVTFGIGFLIQALTGNLTVTNTYCEPIEYRIKMRRLKK